MENLVVIALPRSCSTFFMKQFFNSSLHVVDNLHHELIPTTNRRWVRKYLELPEIEDWRNWDHDAEYANRYINQHPEGVALKVIAHAHKHSFFDVLNRPNTTFVHLWRTDEASTLASLLSRRLAQYHATNQKGVTRAYVRASRTDTYRYTDIGKLNAASDDDAVRRMLELVYFNCIGKTKSIMEMIPASYTFTELDFHNEWSNPELESKFGLKFDYSKFTPPSHYSEMFEDWQIFENDVNSVLGPIPGIS